MRNKLRGVSRSMTLTPLSAALLFFLSSCHFASGLIAGFASKTSQSLRLSQLDGAKKGIPILEDWKVLTNGRIVGNLKNHPEIPDGSTITTSPVEKPELASSNKVVITYSGSKYRLGEPKYAILNGRAIAGTSANGSAQPAMVTIKDLQRQSKIQFDLNGDVVGDDDQQYLLCGRPMKSTSAKSSLFKAYRADDDGLPEGYPVLVKMSNNWEALSREAENYRRITQSGVTRGQFVKMIDFLPTASTITKKYRSYSALIVERGIMDLKRYIAQNGPLKGKELREAASAGAQCLQAIHAAGLVWTDLKSENFVMLDDGAIKGIDLESAMPLRDNPVDYSPEATPPEFATAFLEGEGPYFVLDYNYDVWSYGMLLYELATGKGFFDGKKPVQITRALKAGVVIDLSDKDVDPRLKDLIKQCLSLDPKSRPNIVQILLHPYFLTTGLGPISF